MAVVKQVEIIAKTGEAVKDVKKLNKEVDDTSKKGKAAGKGLKGAFAGFSSAVAGAIPMLARLKVAMISTGVGALVVAFGSLVALFKSAASLGADFQKSLSGLRAVSGATGEEIVTLSNQAKQLGETTAFTAVQVVGLQTELAKLGFSVRDIENSTPAILDLAASLEVDLSSAAMLAGSTVRAFGLDTTDTQRVVDVLALSTASSALNFEGLTESLKLVAPTSRATGVSIEKTTALLGVLADSGLKGSIAGTGLSKTFIMLNKKGLTLEQGFEKINSSSNKMNTAIELVGIVGAKSLLNLASSGEKIEGLTKSFENAEGAARRMAELRLDNLAGDITKLGSAWDGFLLEVEDGGGIINKVQRFLTQLLTKGVEKLGVALDFYAFFVRDYFNFWAKGLSMTKEIAEGSFGYLTGIIKKFSNQAILLISEIPIIGKAIDADKAKANLLIAEAELDASQKRIQNGIDISGEIIAQTNSFWARYSASEVAKEKRMAEQKAAKALEESSLEDVEAKKEEEARLKKEREKARLTREKLLAKYLKKEQDLLANDATKKLELERERAYKEIELISETKEQENALKLAYDAGYLIKKAEILFKLRGEAGDAEEKYNAEQVKLNLEKNKKIKDDNQALADAEEELRDMKIRATRDSLVALSQLFKQGTAASKAAALADLAIGTGVGFIQALDIAQKGAKATGPLAPFAFPVFYATQVASVLGAAAKAKGILSAVKGGGNVPTPTPPPVDNPRSFSVEPQAPQFNVVGTSGTSQIADLIGSQPPIKAYVVSSDVTTSQSLDRNIIESATI